MSPHRHDMHELFVCLNDKAVQHVEGKSCAFQRGRAFLLYSGCCHQVDFMPRVAAEFLFVCFDVNHLANAGFLKLQEQMLVGQRKELFFSDDNQTYRQFNVRTVNALHATVSSPGLLQDELANVLLAELLITFFRQLETGLTPGAVGNDKRERIAHLCRRIAADPTLELNLDEAAGKVGICRSAFAKLIKETTGFTWREYVLDCRLKKVVKMLAETETQITEIALSSGFNNIGYFHRVFQAKFDRTPARMRRELQQNRFPPLLHTY